MGILKPSTGDIPLGLEVAGVVRDIGANVDGVAIGDRVVAMPPDACFKTLVCTPASLIAKIPDNLSFEEAASMPICYTTAIESLLNVGRLEKGQVGSMHSRSPYSPLNRSNKSQTVLIHSAAGGVGHAAIQICQLIGAVVRPDPSFTLYIMTNKQSLGKIFATVGNEEKVDHLVKNFGIPANHIFNSREDSFAQDIMRETDGRGVDIVLNSLSGELLHASWDCVAEFGTMIELGKRDALGGGKLQMRNFVESRSYSCVDMTHLAQRRPQQAGAYVPSDMIQCVPKQASTY